MIRIKTINIQGREIERTFESASDILTNWWDENGTDLPGGDDEVLEVTLDGKSIRSIRHFAELIQELESFFWRGVSTIKKMEEREQVNNQDFSKSIGNRVTEYCPHCNEEITLEWDVTEHGYQAFCARCGRKLMLCSECLYKEDLCDWSEETGYCYRQIEQLWKDLEQIIFKEDEEYRLVLAQDYKIALLAAFEDGRRSKEQTLICFPEGTDREEIWKWYDKNHPKGIEYLLYGEDRKKQTYEEWKEIALKNILQAHGLTMEDELDESEEFYLETNQFFGSYRSVQTFYGSSTNELLEEKQIVKTENGYVAVNIV